MNQQVEIDALRAGSSQEKIPRHYSTSAATRALLRKRFLKKNTFSPLARGRRRIRGMAHGAFKTTRGSSLPIAKIAEIKGFFHPAKELRRQAVSIDSSSFFLL
ncbi:MAG: hypothetical protein R6W66_06990 [Pelovirga sp.]